MIIQVTAKCADAFAATLRNDDHSYVGEYDGYVPDFFPGEHYGDYVELDIDTETGKILNWRKPTKEDLKIFKEN